MALTSRRAGTRPAARPAPSTAPRAAWAVVASFAVVAVIGRFLWARHVVSPFMYNDELGYVGVARLLAGDAPSLYGVTYFPGWGIVLAPFAALLGPSDFHVAAQGVNALAAGATIPVLHLIGRRAVRLDPWVSAGAAIAGGGMAAATVHTAMMLPEALLVLVVAAVVLLTHQLFERPTTRWAVATGGMVAAAYAVHPRALVVLPAFLAVVALGAWLRCLRPPVGIVAAVTAIGGAVLVQVVHGWATSQLYPVTTKPSVAGSPAGAILEPAGSAVIAAGQSWYLLVASAGLVALGVVCAARVGWLDRGRPRSAAGVLVVLGLAGSLALGTMASHRVGTGVDVGRADLPVYGRYLEQWLPVLMVYAPGLGRRWALRTVAASAALIVGLGFLVHAVHSAATWRRPVAWQNIASLRLPWEVVGKDHLPVTSLVVAGALLVLGGTAALIGRRWWLLPLGAVLAVNTASGAVVVESWAGPASKAWAARLDLPPIALEVGEPVWVDGERYLHLAWAYNAQYWHPDLEVRWFAGSPPPEARLVIGSPSSEPAGVTVLGTEPHGGIALWDTG